MPEPEYTPSSPSFAQPEHRSFLVPVLLALLVLAAAIGYGFYRFPNASVAGTALSTSYLPTHTVFASNSIVVGQNHSEDQLFVVPTVRLTNHLRFPVTVDSISATLTDSSGAQMTVTAINHLDRPNIETSFPALKPLAGTPLQAETIIQPNASAGGTVLLSFPFTPEQWAARQSAVVTVSLYHQEPVSIPIPK